MDRFHSDIEAIFKEHLQYVDDVALIVLKGHLVIEEHLDRILTCFFFHPEHLENASLRFPQKVDLVRGFSVSEQDNSMWAMAIALNSLRNQLAHSLETDKRQKKLKVMRDLYFKESDGFEEKLRNPDMPDQLVLYWSVAMLHGFLDACLGEARRFRGLVDSMDRAINRREPAKSS